MNTYRKNAVTAGILLITATALGILVQALTSPLFAAGDVLAGIAAAPQAMTTAVFLYFLMALSCAGIGLSLYPILRQYNESLAIGAAGLRLIEAVVQLLGSASLFALLALSQNPAGTQSALVQMIRSTSDWLSNGPMLISWSLGALLYYYAFYRHGLAPRWLSLWGLIGIALALPTAVLAMLNLIPAFGTLQNAANLPIGLQELVFAGWLIFKGVKVSVPQPATAPRPVLAAVEA